MSHFIVPLQETPYSKFLPCLAITKGKAKLVGQAGAIWNRLSNRQWLSPVWGRRAAEQEGRVNMAHHQKKV